MDQYNTKTVGSGKYDTTQKFRTAVIQTKYMTDLIKLKPKNRVGIGGQVTWLERKRIFTGCKG